MTNRLEILAASVRATHAECVADLRRSLAEAQRQRHIAEAHLAVKLAELVKADETIAGLRDELRRAEADLEHVIVCRDGLARELEFRNATIPAKEVRRVNPEATAR